MPDVVLSDLLAWEPRLAVHRVDREQGLDPEISWVVSARAIAPLIPGLRGKEVMVLSDAALGAAGSGIASLLGHLAEAQVAAAIAPAGWNWDHVSALPPSLVLLHWHGDRLGLDTESELNRLLTEQRGAMYRNGMEFGRMLAALTTASSPAEEVVRRAATTAGTHVALMSGSGATLVAAGPEPGPNPGRATEVPLANGNRLRLVPSSASDAAISRIYAERLALALDAAASRTDRERPRGPVRASALQAFLTRPAPLRQTEVATVSARLALPIGAQYVVALVATERGSPATDGWLRMLGVPHEAGRVDGAQAWLVEQRTGRTGHRPPVGASSGPATAVSARVDLADVPVAARQARFILGLIASGASDGPMVRFDDDAELGAYRLLFELWGEPSLDAFVHGILGRLPEEDRRGDLRETLLAYLATGGSQVDAAAQLGIHRNTLAYRLRRVAQACGSDPTDPSRRMALHLALLAQRLPKLPVPGPDDDAWTT